MKKSTDGEKYTVLTWYLVGLIAVYIGVLVYVINIIYDPDFMYMAGLVVMFVMVYLYMTDYNYVNKTPYYRFMGDNPSIVGPQPTSYKLIQVQDKVYKCAFVEYYVFPRILVLREESFFDAPIVFKNEKLIIE